MPPIPIKAEKEIKAFLTAQAEARTEFERDAGYNSPTGIRLRAAADTARKLADAITGPYKRAHAEAVARAKEKYHTKVDPVKAAYWAALK